MAHRAEPLSQRDLVYVLRAQIDQAIRHRSRPMAEAAIRTALEHPRSLRSVHVRKNLGSTRMSWLEQNGALRPEEPTEIAGLDGIKTTIKPDIES